MEKILVGVKWVDLEEIDLEEEKCIDCGATAEVATYIGKKDGVDLYWAQCRPCAGEVIAASIDAMYRSEQELDYFSGRE
jgi:hypothetical protein